MFGLDRHDLGKCLKKHKTSDYLNRGGGGVQELPPVSEPNFTTFKYDLNMNFISISK